MITLKKAATSRVARGATVLALAGAGLIGLATESQAAATYTVLPKTGPTTAGAVLSITGTGFRTAAGALNLFAGATAVQYTTSTCPATHAAATATVLDSTALTVPTATRIVSTAPALPLTASAATAYTICVYGTASSNALLGSAAYKAYPVPTITAANVSASGPAAGGNSVVVTGTNFTATSVVKFGTFVSPKVTVAANGLSLTAVAPAQPAAAVAVSVTTEGGTNATPSTATWDDYTYTNAIAVSPNLGDGTVGNVITVSGVGFTNALNTVTNANAAVVFTRAGMTTATDDVAKCSAIQIISDNEITCVTPALTAANVGAFIVVVTTDDTSATGGASAYETVVSLSATYTVAAF
jgi:hypothetical protein